MAIFTVHQAKTNLSQLLADVEAGKEVVIARGKEPVARLVPMSPSHAIDKPRRVPGLLKGIVHLDDSFFDPLPDDELALWEGRRP